MPEVHEALAEVRRVFGKRPKPARLDCCLHCFTQKEIDHLLHTPSEQLTADDLHRPLWKAYTTWGDWPTLAYYVPRLLEHYLAGELMDEEMLYTKLLLASRPQLERNYHVGEPMSAAEAAALFWFLEACLCDRAYAAVREDDWSDGLVELFGVVAALGPPLEPLIRGWKAGEPYERGLWCGLLASLIRTGYRWNRLLPNTYLPKLRATPENEEALLVELAAEPATLYLLDHLDEAQLFGSDLLEVVERAVGIS